MLIEWSPSNISREDGVKPESIFLFNVIIFRAIQYVIQLITQRNTQELFVILWCSTYMLRSIQAIFRKAIYKGIQL